MTDRLADVQPAAAVFELEEAYLQLGLRYNCAIK